VELFLLYNFDMEEFVVYVLFSETYDKTYVGFTSNLIERIKSHNTLGVKGYTLRYRPCEVIYVEFFNEKKLALNKEKYFKTGVGRAYIKTLLFKTNKL
jgi:putative endonuclease